MDPTVVAGTRESLVEGIRPVGTIGTNASKEGGLVGFVA